jgi:serine kinase of HPr protein (carbohydrate metabolism regulator)
MNSEVSYLLLKNVVDKLQLDLINEADLNKEVNGCYIGDLLSNVMARAKEGDLWITIQGHQNVIAVALLTEVSGVIICENMEIDENTVNRAKKKEINLFKSNLSAYELVNKLANLGV